MVTLVSGLDYIRRVCCTTWEGWSLSAGLSQLKSQSLGGLGFNRGRVEQQLFVVSAGGLHTGCGSLPRTPDHRVSVHQGFQIR